MEAAGDAKKFVEDRGVYLEEAKAALNGGSNGNGKGAVDLGKQIEGLRAVKVRQGWHCGLSVLRGLVWACVCDDDSNSNNNNNAQPSLPLSPLGMPRRRTWRRRGG